MLTSDKFRTDFGQTSDFGKVWADFGLNFRADFRQSSDLTLGKVRADFGQSLDKVQADFGLTSGKVRASGKF